MAIDPGTRAVRFLQQGRSYSSVAKYIARLGLYLHRYDELFKSQALTWERLEDGGHYGGK